MLKHCGLRDQSDAAAIAIWYMGQPDPLSVAECRAYA